MKKPCIKCGKVKSLDEFYRHIKMKDGRLRECIICVKTRVKAQMEELAKDPEWVERERARNRNKYHRLGYREKHKPSPEIKKRDMDLYKLNYPEKGRAKSLLGKTKPSIKGNQLHHWNYNIEFAKDIIELTVREHSKCHRFITYDQEYFMYRRIDTMELLDTKEKHLQYITACINNKPD